MRAGPGNAKGFALVIALVVVALLAVAGLELGREVRLSTALASNFQDRTRARMKALDGLTVAAKSILDDDPDYDSLDEAWAELGKEPVRDGQKEENAEALAGPDNVDLKVRDLGGLLNLNLLVDEKGQANSLWVGVFERLLELTANNPDLLTALQDWLDDDSETRTGGAEAAEYKALGKNYRPRNGPLLDMGELGLVRGFGPEVLSGNEAGQGLAGLVTITGAGKINVNTAPVMLLRALDSSLSESLAQDIKELREERPIKKITELKGLVGMSNDLYQSVSPLLDVKSDWFEVDSTGISGRARYRIRAVLERKDSEVKVNGARIG